MLNRALMVFVLGLFATAATAPQKPDAPAPVRPVVVADNAEQVGLFDRLRARRAERLNEFLVAEDPPAVQAPAPMPAGPGVIAPVVPQQIPPRNVVPITLKDGRTVHLGRIKPAFPPKTLKFKKYFSLPASQAPPATFDYSAKAAAAIARMYGNDRYGNCVIAGKMHQLGIWSGNDSDSGGLVVATDQEVLSQYQGICGPGDNGCNITDVLDVFKSRGLTAGGKTYKIDGYVSVDNTNKLEVQTALYLFGSLTLGIDLPGAWANTDDGGIWDVTGTGIVGGHDVCAVGCNDQGVVICTWAGKRTITWRAFQSKKWITELYTQLAPLWYGNDKLAPCGVDVSALQTDLAAIGGGTIPPIDPPTPVCPKGQHWDAAAGKCVPDTPVPPIPPTPPPVPPGTVTLTLTAEQVQAVITQAGAVTIRKEMTLAELLSALNKSTGAVTIRPDMTLREVLDLMGKQAGPKPLAP